jgi:hypothetical protein
VTTTARHYYEVRRKPIRLIVLHSMESDEKGDTAESCKRYFETTDRTASAHVCVDNNSTARCVDDEDTAFGAKSANADGLHIEHAGRARQSRADWLDDYSWQMLDEQSAPQVREWMRLHGIPARRLTVDQVRDGVTKGITDHATVEKAFPSSGHTDPGLAFPWDLYMPLLTKDPEDDMPTIDEIKKGMREVLNEGTAAGQKSWATTSKATLAAVQTVAVEVRGVRDIANDVKAALADLRQAVADLNSPPASGGEWELTLTKKETP